jgi:ribosomal protein L11 methyltransferase
MIFALSFDLELQVKLKASANAHARENVLARFNDACEEFLDSTDGQMSFMGVTEGVMLSEEAHTRGYETESWVLDEGMAPHERDWLSHEHDLTMVAYFKDEASATRAAKWLQSEYVLKTAPKVEAEADQDWNAKWKASFTGIDVSPDLRVLPPWSEEWEKARDSKKTKGIIAINPGAGFGTGTHETTQLCLQTLLKLGDLTGKTILDFGSGSGILGIAAALQGGSVTCVEIDPMANENAHDNAKLNAIEHKIKILETIPESLHHGKVDVLLANILRPILLRFAPLIKDCLKPNAELVLSGLIETDLDEVIRTYQEGGAQFEIEKLEKNEWRALRLRRKKA